MDQPPSHQDIITLIHAHDVRLTRVEERQSAMQGEQHDQSSRMDGLAAEVQNLAKMVTSMTAKQQVILWFVVVGVPIIAGLEIWDRIGRQIAQ